MRLSKKVINKLKKDLTLRQGLAWKTGVSERTILNRVNANSELLTTADSLEFLEQELGIPKDELLEKVKA